MTADVIIADRCPAESISATNGGSIVRLISCGLSDSPGGGHTIWVSPAEGDDTSNSATSKARHLVTRVFVPKDTHDDYYLTVGAGRIWMVLHGLSERLAPSSLEDVPWQRFVEVNRRVAAAVVKLAPTGSRVTVHDYNLLLAVPEIRRFRRDVTLVYVHHTPWPEVGQVTDAVVRKMLRGMVMATLSCDAVSVSAHQWKKNLESWSSRPRIDVTHPGIDSDNLKRRAMDPTLGGCWASLIRSTRRRPLVAAVGRTDPSKNFDILLRAWAGLVADGVPGVLCLHLVPTSRRMLPAYRNFAQTLVSIAQESNRIRQGSVVVVEREAQDDALQLLQHADVVVVPSRSDGWNLVAAEACALGADSQKLILSAKVGAAELLRPISMIVDDPNSHPALAGAIRSAIKSAPAPDTISRKEVKLPMPADWWNAIVQSHQSALRRHDL